MYIGELHDQYLKEEYFLPVMSIKKNPRYKNKREMDPQVKCFLDENNIKEEPEWGLPVPNPEAAYKSLSKYGKDLYFMKPSMVENMNEAWDWTERQVSPYMSESRVKSAEEVIDGLDKTTSTGAPWNLKYPKKKQLFEEDPDFIKWINDDWERLAVDPEWTSPSTNSLKEEIRPTVKTLQNKIRTFTAMAVDITIHGNRLFSDMNEKMNDSHLKTSSAVGMSPYNGNWDRLYRKLRVFPKGYALDESEYDSSLRSYMMWGCARLRWRMLRKEDQTLENLRRLLTVYRNLINTLIITPDGIIVMKLAGNPSGSMNTINDNTLILYTLLAYAWIQNYPEGNHSYEEFESNTAKVLVGDDNTWTVSDWAHDFFNAKTIICEWNKIGVTTTTDSLEPRPAEELDFLSAKTVFLDGQAIPVYDRTKMMTTLLYAPKLHMTPATTLQRTAALLTVGWTDLPFRKFCRQLIKWLLEKFDDVLADDERWILAKCGILTDSTLYQLFMGKGCELRAQSMFVDVNTEWGIIISQEKTLESTRKIKKSNKIEMSINTNNQPKARKATKGRRRANKKNQGRKIGPVAGGKNPTQKQRQRPRRKNNPNGGQSRMLAGKGSVRNASTNRKSMLLEEDEYIGEVTGAATAANFGTTQFPVNIGQAGTFPWGAGVVKNNFEKYQFEYLEFYYKREVSEFATNGTTGKVMLHFDGDASDAPPLTKQQVEDTDPHKDGMPCENISLVIPRKFLNKLNDGHFIRPAGLPGASDIKTYDVGNFYISTQGLANNSAVVGELHVRYRCRVFHPILETIANAPTNNQVSLFQSASAQAQTTTVAANLLAATVVANGLNVVNTSGSFVPPVGNYLVDVNVSGKDTVSEAFELLIDLQKNAASVYPSVALKPQQQFNVAVGAGADIQASISFFVTANGTDAFTIPVICVGAAGTLTANGSVRFTAV